MRMKLRIAKKIMLSEEPYRETTFQRAWIRVWRAFGELAIDFTRSRK